MDRPLCLICEDEMLISIDLQTCLEDIGMAVAGPFVRGADALAWAAANKPDLALLDYLLQDGDCLPLISALREQQVPIIIHSGWLPAENEMPPEMNGLPWLSKPIDRNILLRAMAKAAPQINLPQSTNVAGAALVAGEDLPGGKLNR